MNWDHVQWTQSHVKRLTWRDGGDVDVAVLLSGRSVLGASQRRIANVGHGRMSAPDERRKTIKQLNASVAVEAKRCDG